MKAAMKFYSFLFVVGTHTQRKRLLKLIDKERLSDDIVWISDKTYQSTWRYQHEQKSPLLEVGFRTHCKDPQVVMELIIDKMGKAIKLGFSEHIVKHRLKQPKTE
jgi:hypothetical protein